MGATEGFYVKDGAWLGASLSVALEREREGAADIYSTANGDARAGSQ
jgi:hypothetical protein